MSSCELDPGLRSIIHPSELDRFDEVDRTHGDDEYQHVYIKDGLVVVESYQHPSEILKSSHTFRPSETAHEYVAQKMAEDEEAEGDMLRGQAPLSSDNGKEADATAGADGDAHSKDTTHSTTDNGR